MTQKQLGEKAGLKQAYITRVERGVTLPRVDTLLKLADALELKIELVPNDVARGDALGKEQGMAFLEVAATAIEEGMS